MHPTVWLQWKWAENRGGGLRVRPPPLGAELDSHLAQCGLDQVTKAHLHVKCRVDPSSRLATMGMGRKLERGLPPFWGGVSWVPMRAKFHLDPSNRLATIHQRYIQDKTDRQRSDSIGRTVVQTVTQKFMSGFSRNFGKGRIWTREKSIKFCR